MVASTYITYISNNITYNRRLSSYIFLSFGSAGPPVPDSMMLTVKSASIPAILFSMQVYTVLPETPSILFVKIHSTAACASGPEVDTSDKKTC